MNLADTYGFTGPITTQAFNDILWVGPSGYATIAAAVTAAGSAKTIIAIRSTYTGTECPAQVSNIVFWDFRGNAAQALCVNNDFAYNTTDAIGLTATLKQQSTFTGITPGAAVLTFWPITNLTNATLSGATTLDGVSTESITTGTLSGTLTQMSGNESVAAVRSTGGTVALAEGVIGYVADAVGTTTALTEARGLDGIGCTTTVITPGKCWGLYGRKQGTKASGTNYGLGVEANLLMRYDSVTLSKWKIDAEDNTGTAQQFIYLDGANNKVHFQAPNAAGIFLDSSDGTTRANYSSTGFRVGDGTAATAVLDVSGNLKLEPNNAMFVQEGTCAAGNAAFGQLCENSTDHALTLSNNGGAYGHVLATGSLDAKGIQTKRVSGCATSATINTTCTVTVTWTTAFPDANYTATCSGDLITSGVPVLQAITAKVGASVTVQTINLTAVAAQFTTIDCTATHD